MSQLGHSRRDWLRATIGPRSLRPESGSVFQAEVAPTITSLLRNRGTPVEQLVATFRDKLTVALARRGVAGHA